MRSKIIFILLFFLAFVIWGYEYVDKIQKTFPIGKDGTVHLSNINGAIKIDTHGKNEIEILAIKSTKYKEDLAKVQVVFEQKGNMLKVFIEKPDKIEGMEVEFEVSVPEKFNMANFSSVNGSIECRGIFNELNLKTVNGEIKLTGDFVTANIKTVNGSLDTTLEQILKGDLTMKSVNGSITAALNEKSGFSLEAETVNGDIKSQFDNVNVSKGFVGCKATGNINNGKYKLIFGSVNGTIKIIKI